MSLVLSKAVVSSVGLICKAFLNSGLCSVQVNGLQNLKNALSNPKRDAGQGVMTICNHISTLDDPVIWGVLPVRYYFSTQTTRWALGASEIMFTNPIFSTFFSLGQTLETFRGKGIYQDAVNVAIQKINQGGWVHLYGEGKVNQPLTYPLDELGQARLPRFKWGVGRILMEAKQTPVVIPMWLSGFDQLMPEGRPFPYKYFPRPGARLTVTFGEPISPEEILEALDQDNTNIRSDSKLSSSVDGIGQQSSILDHTAVDQQNVSLVRQKVTSVLHRDVEALGRSISGRMLGRVAQKI